MAFGGNFAQLVDRRPSGIIFSPTQVEKYALCKRKWAFEYIGGIRPPPHPSAELGTLVHSVLEAWLTYGTPPNVYTKAGKIAAKMIANLPFPGTGVTERSSWFVTRNGFAYTFKIDWSGIFYGWPTIIDHKTTGNLTWAKTEAGLHCDVQAISYTIAGCLGFAVDDIQLLWNYGTTKDRDPIIQPVRTRIRLPIAEEKFERVVEPIAAEMLSARTSRLNPHSFEPNPNACSDFGGCPHIRICNLTQEERIRALMDQQNPTLAARLATMPAGGGGFVPPNGHGAPAGYVAAPVQTFVQPQQQQPVQAGFVPPQQQPQVAFVPPQQQPVQAGFVPPQQPVQAGFVPPQQQQQPPQQQPQNGAPQQTAFVFQPPTGAPQPIPQPGTQQPPFIPTGGPNPPESGAPFVPQHVQPPQVAQPPQVEEEKGKRGRGRPRKSADAGPVLLEQEAFIAGVGGMIGNPQWNGQMDQVLWAGDMAVQALHARKWS